MIADSLAQLRAQGYKITPQRRAVLNAFEECPSFPTAQQLLASVRKTQPDVSLDTIYRNLTLLTVGAALYARARLADETYL